MTKDWYPEYIKKYESMKKDTHQTGMWAKDMKRNIFIYGKTLNFINNQGNSNETHNKTQYNSHPIDKYKRQSRPRVC